MSKKTDYLGTLNTNTVLRLSLDEQIYKTAISNALGLSTTNAGAGKDVVPVSLKVAYATGKFIKLKARCTRGTGDAEKTRIVPLICEVAKVSTAINSLIGDTVNLGNTGSGDAWTIKGFVA
jgi:hypothetical protein